MSSIIALGRGFALAGLASCIILFFGATYAHAAPTIDAVETVANKVGDGAITATTTQENVEEVQAVLTVEVTGALESGNGTVTIGTCEITFADLEGTPEENDDLDCTPNPDVGSATIDRTVSGSEDYRTATSTAAALRALTGLVDSEGRPLDITGSDAKAVFTRVSPEIADGDIAFLSSVSEVVKVEGESVTGVIGHAQVDVVTLSGTPEEGDAYSIITSELSDTVTYTVAEGDTLADVRDGLLALVLADGDYGGAAFTATTTGGASITFTAKVAGTGFTLTVDDSVGGATEQEVEFTLNDVEAEYDFNITINSTEYSFTSTNSDEDDIVAGLLAAGLGTDSDVNCSDEGGGTILCVADSAGTPFTYSASVTGGPTPTPDPEPSTPSRRSGGGGYVNRAAPQVTPAAVDQTIVDIITTNRALFMQAQSLGIQLPAIILQLLGLAPEGGVRDLDLGMEGSDVIALQNFLIGQGHDIPAGATGYFGEQTRAALAAYQQANGISPALGYFGPITRAQIQAAGLGWW